MERTGAFPHLFFFFAADLLEVIAFHLRCVYNLWYDFCRNAAAGKRGGNQ
jgi:hypothetical protein